MSAMAGYAFARLNFKGKNVIFSLLLATIFIPAIVTLVPSFVLFVKVYKWGGTPLPLIIPGMFGSVITTFYLKQYLSMLPKELEDAAMIDGLNRWGIFTRIMLPLSKSALITQFVLSFIGAYNDYLGPLMYIGSNPDLFTVQLVLRSLNAPLNRQYNLLLTGSMLGILPIFLLFVFFQKQIIEGMSMSGVRK
jgi:multiple sugar transport system permease protein